ncbi:MAG: NAD-binding protein [Spirochaetes bacterium]|nr:NAD-binding protein [Spirochaetota bacterium]MCK5266836.1 NAD-binding protein [Spirochaetota bacterium]
MKQKDLKHYKRKLYNYLRRLKDEILFRIISITVGLIVISSFVVYLLERDTGSEGLKNLGNSLWYVIVTMSSTGYGDVIPKHPEGKIFGVIIILIGVVITAFISGIIASVFVDKRLKEGKGLKEVKWRNHVILCGWNDNTKEVLESLIINKNLEKEDVVLVNNLDETEISQLIYNYNELRIKFVKGDHVNENILKRAGILNASSVIIVPDNSGTNTLQNADERTILSAMAIKSMNPNIKTCTQILKKKNEIHLKRAEIDEIIISGEFSGYLISNAATSPGILQLVKELLNYNYGHTITKNNIPKAYIGKTFDELSKYFITKKESILIGVLTEEKDFSLNDMLSDDYSAIDAFIKRKFEESEQSFFEGEKMRYNIKINPGLEYTILDTDVAFVITQNVESLSFEGVN